MKRALLGAFEWPRVAEAGARGAALLAGIAAGRYAGIDDLPATDAVEPERSPR